MPTVKGYDLYKPLNPSSLTIPLTHSDTVNYLHNYNLCLITSVGAIKKSWTNVVSAPIEAVENTS